MKTPLPWLPIFFSLFLASANAAVLEKEGLGCLRANALFADRSANDSEFPSVEAHLQAIEQAHVYGDALVKEFDAYLEQGDTLETMQMHSDVYARLQALHAIRSEVMASFASLFQNRVAARIQANPEESLSSAIHAESESALSVLESASRARRDSRALFVGAAVISEALNEARLLSGAAGCASAESVRASLAQDWNREVIGTARSLSRAPIRPEESPDLSTIMAKVDARVKEAQLASRVDAALEPTEAPPPGWGSVYYPSTGKAGNITGLGFPKGVWALTFDDGPGPLTPKVLDNLAKHGMKATFFVLGKNVGAYSAFSKRALAEGHAIASHSYTHPQFLKISASKRQYEVNAASTRIENVLGIRPRFFRLPYGQGVNSTAVRSLIANAGMVHVFWSVDTLDWQIKDPERLYQRTLLQMKAGRGVILFHDIHSQSVTASEKVMRYLTNPANGFEPPVTIPAIVDRMNAAASH